MAKRKTTDPELIAERLRQQEDLMSMRRKIYRLRCALAGDISGLLYGRPQTAQESSTRQLKPSQASEGLHDINVVDIEEGRSNRLLQAIKNLAFQTSFKAPIVEFENCDQEVAVLMQSYMQVRLGPGPRGCNAHYHMTKALMDFLSGSMGYSHIGFNAQGFPVVTSVDSLDVSFDQQARVPAEARWTSVVTRRPFYEWADIFDKGKPREVLTRYAGKLGRENWDKVIEVEEYTDIENENGTRASFIRGLEGDIFDEPLEVTTNPFYFDIDGFRQPFLPTDPCYFLDLPSVRFPLSVTEMMLPSQIAIWTAERAIKDTVKSGGAFWDTVDGAYESEELEKLEDGTIGAILMRKSASVPPANRVPGLEIPATLNSYQQYHDQNITAESGVNPYAMGNKVDGISYASEVNAIQSQSGLTAGVVARAHAAHWERTVTKYLATCYLYDDMPVRLRYDDVVLEFGPDDPVRDFLQPDAKVTVREDSMSYAPREQEMVQASNLLSIATSLAQLYPQGVGEAYKKVLEANGIKNTGKWMEQPEMNNLAMPDQGAASAQAAGIA